MATYDFTGANGDPLPSGLTALEGSFEIQGNALASVDPTPSYGAWLCSASQDYASGQPVSVVFNANGDVGAGATGVMVRFLDNQNYFFASISPSNERLRLFKRIGGSNVTFGTDGDYIIPSFSNSANYTIEVIDDGADVVVNLDSVERIRITDSELASNRGSGLRFGSSVARIDDYVITEAVGDSISVGDAPKQNHVYQRANNSYQFSFPVTYTGSPVSLRYRLLDASDDSVISDWSIFDASPSGGASTLTGSVSASLTEYVIEVDFSNNASVNDTQSIGWYVGDNILICGQSLSEDMNTDGAVSPLNGYFYFNGNASSQTSTGTGAYEIAKAIVQSEQVAVCITNTGVGSSGLASQTGDADYWNNPSGSLWTNTVNRISSMTGGANELALMCWHQGSKDSISDVNTQQYLNALNEFFTRVRLTFSGPSNSSLPVALAIIARSSTARTDQQTQAIRDAQISFAGTDARTRLVNSFFIATEDGTHGTDSAYTELGKQYALAFYDLKGLSFAEPLKILSVSYETGSSALILTFDSDLYAVDTSYPVSSIGLFIDGLEQVVTSFTRTGTRTADIICQSPISGGSVELTIPYGIGVGQDAINMPRKTGVTIPNVVGDYYQYVEPFSSFSVVESSQSTPANVSILLSPPSFSISASAAPAQSTLNAVLTGIPDGTYSTRVVIPSTGEAVAEEKAWNSGSALFTLPVPAGTSVEYYAYDTGSNEAGLQLGVTE